MKTLQKFDLSFVVARRLFQAEDVLNFPQNLHEKGFFIHLLRFIEALLSLKSSLPILRQS